VANFYDPLTVFWAGLPLVGRKGLQPLEFAPFFGKHSPNPSRWIVGSTGREARGLAASGHRRMRQPVGCRRLGARGDGDPGAGKETGQVEVSAHLQPAIARI